VSPVFKHLLVPVDFTEQNLEALTVARNMAEQNPAQVTLLHVIETIDYVTDDEIDQFYDTLQSQARRKMDQLAIPFQDAQIQIDSRIVLGKRAREIVTYALQNEVDLVVMSSHRVDLSDGPRGWGTLSHQVSVLCPCAVLLIR
jgi:nucleotide-binding universal stress UspA family protein